MCINFVILLSYPAVLMYCCAFIFMQSTWTALVYAANRGHVDVIRILLSHGAEVNKTDVSTCCIFYILVYLFIVIFNAML